LSSKDEPSREELWKQLRNAVVARSSEDQVTWSIFGIFWAANALLLLALFTASDYLGAGRVVSIVSVVGIFTSLVGLLLVHRALGYIGEYERVISDVEDILFEKYPNFRLTLKPKTKSRIGGIPARVVMHWAIAGFLGIWIIGFSIGLCILLHVL
jgi:hypothetical protein